MELKIILLSLISELGELILFFSDLEKEKTDEIKEDTEKEELRQQIKELYDRIDKLEKRIT